MNDKISIEMIGLIISAASFLVTVAFWLIDSFVFEKKLRKKKKATIYRVTLKKNPKNIDIYDEDYLGKIYLKHDGKIRRLGSNDIRYLEDKRKVEMTTNSDYACSKENPYTTNNMKNPHDEHDARVPQEEEKEITVNANDYIFVGENEHQNSAAFYIKRAKAYTFRQLLVIALISIFASSTISFFIADRFKAPVPKPPPSTPFSMVRCIEYLKDGTEKETDNLKMYEEYSNKFFLDKTANPFANEVYYGINTIGSSMWYVYGRLLYERFKVPYPLSNFFVTRWVKDDKLQYYKNPEVKKIEEAMAGDILVWRDPNADADLKDYRLRVGYIESINKDKQIFITESGLTAKRNALETAYLMPCVKYAVCTKEIKYYYENLTDLNGEVSPAGSILEIIGGPRIKEEEGVVDSKSGVQRKKELYYWYHVKDRNDEGWVRLEDFNRGGGFNTEFNLQGIDLDPHPVERYWMPATVDNDDYLGNEAMVVLRISR